MRKFTQNVCLKFLQILCSTDKHVGGEDQRIHFTSSAAEIGKEFVRSGYLDLWTANHPIKRDDLLHSEILSLLFAFMNPYAVYQISPSPTEGNYLVSAKPTMHALQNVSLINEKDVQMCWPEVALSDSTHVPLFFSHLKCCIAGCEMIVSSCSPSAGRITTVYCQATAGGKFWC